MYSVCVCGFNAPDDKLPNLLHRSAAARPYTVSRVSYYKSATPGYTAARVVFKNRSRFFDPPKVLSAYTRRTRFLAFQILYSLSVYTIYIYTHTYVSSRSIAVGCTRIGGEKMYTLRRYFFTVSSIQFTPGVCSACTYVHIRVRENYFTARFRVPRRERMIISCVEYTRL